MSLPGGIPDATSYDRIGMKAMKFAFIFLTDGFDPEKHRTQLDTDAVKSTVLGVSNMEQALAEAKKFQEQGYDLIELCGSFGPELAKQIADATDNQVPVGYVVKCEGKEQQEIYKKVFGE